MKVTFLGQAGVLLEAGGESLVIDPYLSDNASAFSDGFWARGYPIPLDARELRGARAVVCTHEHRDHLDPVTIAPLLAVSPETTLVIPAAAVPGLPWIVDEGQIRPMRGEGDEIRLGVFTVRSLPAAHTGDYQFEHTPEYGHRWCSVVVEAEGVRVFHAGDTVDWDGFAEAVGPVDLACVPINGRGREADGIVGNLDEREAADLARRLPARHALGIHWDLFPVNPGDPKMFVQALQGSGVQAHYGPAMTTLTIDPAKHIPT